MIRSSSSSFIIIIHFGFKSHYITIVNCTQVFDLKILIEYPYIRVCWTILNKNLKLFAMIQQIFTYARVSTLHIQQHGRVLYKIYRDIDRDKIWSFPFRKKRCSLLEPYMEIYIISQTYPLHLKQHLLLIWYCKLDPFPPPWLLYISVTRTLRWHSCIVIDLPFSKNSWKLNTYIALIHKPQRPFVKSIYLFL